MLRDHGAFLRLATERARTPFAGYAEHDCCVRFAAEAVHVQTGRDLLRGVRRRMRKPLTAERYLAECGGLEAVVDARLDAVAAAMAHRGDVGLIEGERRRQLVVIEGELLLCPAPWGLHRLPRSMLLQAWSAG